MFLLENHYRLLLAQRDDFLDGQDVVCDLRFHRWRDAQRLMHATKVVVQGEKGDAARFSSSEYSM